MGIGEHRRTERVRESNGHTQEARNLEQRSDTRKHEECHQRARDLGELRIGVSICELATRSLYSRLTHLLHIRKFQHYLLATRQLETNSYLNKIHGAIYRGSLRCKVEVVK